MGRLVVIKSKAIDENTEFVLDSAGISIGRGGPNDVRLDGDDFASANTRASSRGATGSGSRTPARRTAPSSTACASEPPRKLAAGDLVRVGETDLRFEA